MTFNAAMNSIPVLLLAIGVDYGLHVVLRIREELKNSPEGETAETMRDFSVEARKLAIRRGTIFTSIALLIAIFTDVVGFLSFRFSALTFLQVFGTVIAIGLFFIYLLSMVSCEHLEISLFQETWKFGNIWKKSIGNWKIKTCRYATSYNVWT